MSAEVCSGEEEKKCMLVPPFTPCAIPFPKVARIRPPPPDNTSLSACGPPHFPSVLTAPRLTQLPPPARAHTHTHTKIFSNII